MRFSSVALPAAGAALAILLGAGAASAATAYASAAANVRIAAGPGAPIIDRLQRGEVVNVEFCRADWCHVARSGPDGWVNANFLVANRMVSRYDEYGLDRTYDGYFEDSFMMLERPRYRYRWPYEFYRSRVCWGGDRSVACLN